MFRKVQLSFYTLTAVALLLASCTSIQPRQTQDGTNLPNDPYRPQTVRHTMPAKEQNTPQLQGGAEIDVRKPHPISNDTLDRKYPNIVALRGPRTSKYVALTFDDGPDRRFTPRVLDVLKRHDVKATFFLMGSRAKALPDVTKRIRNEGHDIGNHTYWHPNFEKESIGRLEWEVLETEKVLEDIVGYRPKLFRSPYGFLNEPIVRKLGQMNSMAIGWSVDSLDWMQLDSNRVQKNVLSNMHPGAVVLMHSGGHWTQDLSGMVEALDAIIPRLKKDGMTFVTVSEMFDVPYKK